MAKKKAAKKPKPKFVLRVRKQDGEMLEHPSVDLQRVIDEVDAQFALYHDTAIPLVRCLVYIREASGKLLVIKGVRSGEAHLIREEHRKNVTGRGDVAGIFEVHPMWEFKPNVSLTQAVKAALNS